MFHESFMEDIKSKAINGNEKANTIPALFPQLSFYLKYSAAISLFL